MNYCVPEFNMDEDYSLPSSSGLLMPKNIMQEDEIMELLWQNGQVVVQSQNPRLLKRSSHQKHNSSAAPPPLRSDSTNQLFMQEDEMISWLQHPLEEPLSFHRDLTDLFNHPSGHQQPQPPPIAHLHQQIPNPPSTSSRNNEPREVTVVDSSDTPAMGHKSKIHLPRRNAGEICGGGGCMSRSAETCELTLTSSAGGSGASATADLMSFPPEGDRKRKGREPIDDATTDYQSEIESYETKKQARGANTKRSRAAEVHNLSERRRRDRINEKMKALQELIPRCTKTDKASMLDEAIEHIKSLQMQLQACLKMMSMGCGMVPVMFPGVQQYMSSMGMGMGMARPVMPFPAALSSSALQTPGTPSHMNPRFTLQPFQMPTIPGPDQARTQPISNQAEHMPVKIPQAENHPTSQPSTSKPSTRRGYEYNEKH